MDNSLLTALALMVIGLVGVNFFYLSDLILLHTPQHDIVIGWKSGVAVTLANMVTLAGFWLVARRGRAQ